MRLFAGAVRRGAAAVALAAVFALPDTATAAGNPEEGRALAEKHCSRCHVVGAQNPLGGANNTASFQMLIKMSDGLERFQTFYVRRPHPVFLTVTGVPKWSNAPSYAAEFTLTLEQVEDIVAYAKTIEKLEIKRKSSQPRHP